MFGIIAVRTANSILGSARAWAKKDGVPITGTEEEMRKLAKEYNDNRYSGNVYYYVEEYDPWKCM